MTWKYAFFLLMLAFVVMNCNKSTQTLATDRARMMQPSSISSFHPEINVSLGWVPYQDLKLEKTGKSEWKIVKNMENGKEGMVPMILIKNSSTQDSIFLQMDIKNELLGKLIKHSAITQQPIQRPFSTFFEEAKCQNCHPSDINVDFGD